MTVRRRIAPPTTRSRRGECSGWRRSPGLSRTDVPTKVGVPIARPPGRDVRRVRRRRSIVRPGADRRGHRDPDQPACGSRRGTRVSGCVEVHGGGARVGRAAEAQHQPSTSPYGLFACADGAVQIAIGSDGLWRRLAGAFDLDQPEWATNRQRVAQSAAMIAAVERGIRTARPRCFARAVSTEMGVPGGAGARHR